jgi:hypothetical protein
MTATLGALTLRKYDPRIRSLAFAHTAHDAGKLFIELRVLDPLTFGSLVLQLWHSTMLSALIYDRSSDPSPQQGVVIKHEGNEFAKAAYAMKPLHPKVQYDQAPGLRLGSTLEHFERLVIESEALHRRFHHVALITDVTPSVCQSYLEAAEVEVTSLKARQGLMTTGHLALQNHFEHFISFGMPSPAIESLREAETLYGPLAALRDEYFISPSPTVLRRYLEATTRIERSAEFVRLREATMSSRADFIDKVAVAALYAADARFRSLRLSSRFSRSRRSTW